MTPELLRQLTPKQRAFLKAFAVCCSVTKAAAAAGISKTTHYAWLKESERYREAYALAEPMAVDALEDEAVRRAFEGYDEPVVYQGNFTWPIGEDGNPDYSKPLCIRKYSDSLLALLLKGKKPQVYRDRHELTGPGGGQLIEAVKVIYDDPPKVSE